MPPPERRDRARRSRRSSRFRARKTTRGRGPVALGHGGLQLSGVRQRRAAGCPRQVGIHTAPARCLHRLPADAPPTPVRGNGKAMRRTREVLALEHWGAARHVARRTLARKKRRATRDAARACVNSRSFPNGALRWPARRSSSPLGAPRASAGRENSSSAESHGLGGLGRNRRALSGKEAGPRSACAPHRYDRSDDPHAPPPG